MHNVAPEPAPAGAEPATPARNRRWIAGLAIIGVFDIGGPLVLYSVLRSHGFSAVTALVLSGIFPAFGVLVSYLRDRRLDAVGALVLVGIAVGTILGLASGSARLVLLEGSVPTAVFGVVCLVSLRSTRPMIYRFALEFKGADTPGGQEFERLWAQFEGFRHVFRLITLVWGLGFLLEALARIAIVEETSTGAALAISKVMPFVVAGILSAWTFAYGQMSRRRGERLAAQSREAQGQQAQHAQVQNGDQ
jgi:hypothetical protein